MCLRAKVYIALVILVGWANLAYKVPSWQPVAFLTFVIYALITLLAAALKLQLPGITGTISVGFCFVLIGVVSLSLPEVLITGCLAALVQCFWHSTKKPRPVQLLFNVANSSIAITGSYQVFHSAWLRSLSLELPVMLAILASTYFFSTTILVAAAIALTEAKSLYKVWSTSYLWAFPYYVLGAATAGLFEIAKHFLGWQSSMLVIPVTYLVYRSYRMYLGRLDDEAKHARETAALHLRTIESLALAIEAKDHTTHEHLRRVQVYAMEIGKELKLSAEELQALQAASILHDIGKIAVPEHILCKPGKLSPEEFQRIKVHPVVGAEILARAEFPYPVVPIVRSHHEKWDGSGYPDGLKGVDIPIGARILSVVDCLDALASDRQYRRALPLNKAMEIVAEQTHKAFDPNVVEILQKRYIELEQLARSSPQAAFTLSTDVEIGRGAAPDAGFEESKESRSSIQNGQGCGDSLVVMLQTLERKASDLPRTEIFSILAGCVRQVIPWDCFVVYSRGTSMLTAEHACGIHGDQLAALRIQVGQGLSGWVAANRKPILNGNPSVDCAELDCEASGPCLRSALAIPVESERGLVGVLTLLREDADAFSPSEMRLLSAAGFVVGQLLETALFHLPQAVENPPTPESRDAQIQPGRQKLFSQ
jgi:putative nucleotidyltransferase with HDIG domain